MDRIGTSWGLDLLLILLLFVGKEGNLGESREREIKRVVHLNLLLFKYSFVS